MTTKPTPDPRIIPGLEPEATQEDQDNFDLIVNTPDEAGAREVAALRVGATRAAIEWMIRYVEKREHWQSEGTIARLDHEKARADAAEGQVKAWGDIVRQAYRGIEYFQGLLDSTAAHLGPEIFVSDDGTVNDYLLRAKVPEMVGELATRLAVSEARSERRRGLLVRAKPMLGLSMSVDLVRTQLHDDIAAEIADVAPATAEHGDAAHRDLERRALALVLNIPETVEDGEFFIDVEESDGIDAIKMAYATLQAAGKEAGGAA